jgi:hypothetical protein
MLFIKSVIRLKIKLISCINTKNATLFGVALYNFVIYIRRLVCSLFQCLDQACDLVAGVALQCADHVLGR